MKTLKDNLVIIRCKDLIYKLKKSGRYDEIISILKTIKMIQDYSLPVDCYCGDDGKAAFRIKVSDLRSDADKILTMLYSNETFVVLEDGDNFEAIFHYLTTHCNMFLHNYANTISHRKTPENDIDDIRSSLILENLIMNIHGGLDDWDIPVGWRKCEQ